MRTTPSNWNVQLLRNQRNKCVYFVFILVTTKMKTKCGVICTKKNDPCKSISGFYSIYQPFMPKYSNFKVFKYASIMSYPWERANSVILYLLLILQGGPKVVTPTLRLITNVMDLILADMYSF